MSEVRPGSEEHSLPPDTDTLIALDAAIEALEKNPGWSYSVRVLDSLRQMFEVLQERWLCFKSLGGFFESHPAFSEVRVIVGMSGVV